MSQPSAGMQSPNMPPAAAPSPDEKTMAMVAHFGNLFTFGWAGIILYLWKKDTSKYIAFHGLQAGLLGVILGIVLGATCIAPLVMYILSIMGGIKVMNGEHYEYPLIGEKVREAVYGKA